VGPFPDTRLTITPERVPHPDPPADREGPTMAVELDPQLLEILACPSDDHAPLRPGTPADPEAAVLTCTSCGLRFPVVDGVPVLLLDEALPAEHPNGGSPGEPAGRG
jgi:uncharacterized protein